MGDAEATDLMLFGLGDLAPMRATIRRVAEVTGVCTSDAMLAASELATNALRHTSGPCRLQAWNPAPNGPLRIEVRDLVPLPLPSLPSLVPSAAGGRGLAIVDHLAGRWGVRIHDGVGKTVWCEIAPH